MKNGQVVYFIENGHVYSGSIVNMQKQQDGDTFQIENYGACEGLWVISSDQVGRTIFLTEKEAQEHKQYL